MRKLSFTKKLTVIFKIALAVIILSVIISHNSNTELIQHQDCVSPWRFKYSMTAFSIIAFGNVGLLGFVYFKLQTYISRLNLAEQKIREQTALLDITSDAILVQDMHQRIIYWNKSAESLYGWSAEYALGKNTSELLHKTDTTLFVVAFNCVLNYGSWQGELHQICSDGREIIVESRWTLVNQAQGEPRSILIANTEITQNKQLEAQLLRSQRLETVGTLAGGIVHDLNNVLSPIMMSVQLLQMKLRDNEYQQLLKTLESNVKRGANLVKQVLLFARGVETKRGVVDLKQLFVEIEYIIAETFPKLIVYQSDISSYLGQINGDTTQIHQVLMNLVVNARDAMPHGGKLTISAQNILIDPYYARMGIARTVESCCCERLSSIPGDVKVSVLEGSQTQGNYILITVTDTGIGIPTNIQERIFEPFFTTKQSSTGTGLGLSTALSIVKNHRGFINVTSQIAQGTCFRVYLPLANTHEPSPILPEGELIKGNGELILVVDDEPTIRKITQLTLESCNYRVLTAADGLEAVSIYAKHQTDISVVLLDLMIPSMEISTAIRTLVNINPEVKIVAMSGMSANYDLSHEMPIGVKGFLTKPCTAKELLQAISRVNK